MESRVLWCYAATPVLLLFTAPADDAVAFAAEAGSTVTKEFTEETTWSVTGVEQTIGGNRQPAETTDLQLTSRRQLAVTDEYRAVAEGRPTRLARAFDAFAGNTDITIEAEGMRESYAMELESELDGEEVVFTWDADAEVFVCRRAGEDEGDVLAGLAEDLDLRSLLPAERVAKGATWTIDLADAGAVLAPGGDLGLTLAAVPSGNYAMLEVEDVIGASLMSLMDAAGEWEGEIRATWKETRSEDGVRLAEIDLELEGSYASDLAEAFEARVDALGVESTREDMALDIEATVEGTGVLAWNLDAGRFESLALELEQDVTLAFGWEVDMGGGPIDIQVDVAMEGASTLAARAEAE